MSGKARQGGAPGNGQAPRTAGKPRQPNQGGARYAPAGTDGTEMPQPKGQKIDEVNEKLETVRNVMTNNMQMAIERGERLEIIEQKSDVLLEDSNKFQNQAAATKRMFCRRQWRNILVISVIAAVLLALIIWWAT